MRKNKYARTNAQEQKQKKYKRGYRKYIMTDGKMVAGYSPSDFFYVSALGSSSESTQIDCGNLIMTGTPAEQEYEKSVCENKKLVQKSTAQLINRSGSHQALEDSQSNYNAALLNMFNMLVGIGGLTYFFVFGHAFAYGRPKVQSLPIIR